MAGSEQQAPPVPGKPSRRLARLGCLLPVVATILFLLFVFAWPRGRHYQASDFETVLFFVLVGLVPVAALAGIVLSVVAFIRARRQPPEQRRATAFLIPLLTILAALGSVTLTALTIWAALVGVARFR
jgi:ABC-type polysaccharide/polyol phosphate export permease